MVFDFAVTTIFARECLEGSIIFGEYRTIILRGGTLAPDLSKQAALLEVNLAAIVAVVLALMVIAAIAVPLAILSKNFDASTAYIIEGISKIVAAISLLQLSLKLPKMFGIYGSKKKQKNRTTGLTRRSIRFNVVWNIWREVAECGVFLIPFFLSGDELEKIPLSAVVGSLVGLLCGVGIYYANRRLTNKLRLCVFAVLLLVLLSAGLFTGGSHKLEVELGSTQTVWTIRNKFWDVERLPMTIFKPFGYNDSRTVLEICCYWLWLVMSALLHLRKYRTSPKPNRETQENQDDENTEERTPEDIPSLSDDYETVELGEGSNEDRTAPGDFNCGRQGHEEAKEEEKGYSCEEARPSEILFLSAGRVEAVVATEPTRVDL